MGILIFSVGCQRPSQQVTIVAVDYAFRVPSTIAPGPTTIIFDNQGRVAHEFSIARLKPGLAVDSLRAAFRSGMDLGAVIDGPIGILFAAPGQPSPGRLQVDFAAGRTYAIICQFRDASDKPPHVDLGMVGSIRIE